MFKKILLICMTLTVLMLPVHNLKTFATTTVINAPPVYKEIGAWASGITATLLSLKQGTDTIANFPSHLESAKNAYDVISPVARQALENSIQTAIETGKNTFELSREFLNEYFYQGEKIAPSVFGSVTDVYANYGVYTEFYNGAWNVVSGSDKVFMTPSGAKIGRISIQEYGYTNSFGTSSHSIRVNGNAFMYLYGVPEGYDLTNITLGTLNALAMTYGGESVATKFPLTIVNSADTSISYDLPTWTNKDYFDSQIDEILKNTETGAINLAVPDVVAYPVDQTTGTINRDTPLSWDDIKGWIFPDGSIYEHNPSFESSEPKTIELEDGTTATGVMEQGNSYVDIKTGRFVAPIEGTPVLEGNPPITGNPPTTPTTPTTPSIFKPFVLLMAFLKLLMSVVMYLLRLIEFLTGLPFIAPKEIPAYLKGFNFFKNLSINGINVFSIVMTMFNFALAFGVFKVLQKVFNTSR